MQYKIQLVVHQVCSYLSLSLSLFAYTLAVGTGEVHFGEVAADIYTQSMVYVDCMSNAEQELQGLPQPLGMHELGSIIIKGNYPSEDSLTIFQSMGKYCGKGGV